MSRVRVGRGASKATMSIFRSPNGGEVEAELLLGFFVAI